LAALSRASRPIFNGAWLIQFPPLLRKAHGFNVKNNEWKRISTCKQTRKTARKIETREIEPNSISALAGAIKGKESTI